jgi:hypothetical protein
MKGKGVAGITVVLRNNSGTGSPTTYQDKTDQEGNYKIVGVPAGSYEITPEALSYVVSSKSGGTSLVLVEGESVEEINFTLTKGAVVTGRITNSEGQPLIEQFVVINPVEATSNSFAAYMRNMRLMGATDDRGIYRIFGLPQGKYRVSVAVIAGGVSGGMGRRRSDKPTFYPDVTDMSKAAIVELNEGGEATNIDIRVDTNDTSERFSVSGRVVDSAAGQPVPNIRIAVHYISSGGGGFSGPGFVSDTEGNFKVEGLSPGKYQLATENSDLRADPVSFEVINGDVNGLVLKTFKGASVSGQIILEDSDKSLRGKPIHIFIYVHNSTGSSGRSVNSRPDGSFSLGGLREGTVTFEISPDQGGPIKGLGVSRVERDGVVEPRGIEVKDGEQVTGLKVFVRSNNGTIRGAVKLENGEMPADGQIAMWLRVSDPQAVQSRSLPQPRIDSRGHFIVEGLPPGTYEVNAMVHSPTQQKSPPSAKQQVTVTDGVVSEVTITIDLTLRP